MLYSFTITGTSKGGSMKTVGIIPQLYCPECGGTDIRLWDCRSPGYYSIQILFVCFECKNKFVGQVQLENTYKI